MDAQKAKNWWSSLSINEQKKYKIKYLGEYFPNVSVYTKCGKNLIVIYTGFLSEHKPI